LQCAAGIEGGGDGLGVAAERLLALELEVGGETAQAVHLVAHLAGGGVGGTAEAGVERVHVIEQRGELGVECVAGGGELALAFDGHGARGEELGERVFCLGEDAFEGELVLLEQLGDGGLDESSGEARLGVGLAAEDLVEERRAGKEM